MNTDNPSNSEIVAQGQQLTTQKKISVTFNLTNAQTQTASVIDLENLSENDSITENIATIVKKVFLDVLRTDPKKLELALSNKTEADFVEALSHYQESDENLRQQIYSLVNQALKQKTWRKSYLKILVRIGTLAENSLDFSAARNYFKQALTLKMDEDTHVGISLSYANCYTKEGKLDAAIQMYQSLIDAKFKKVHFQNIAWCHHNLGKALIERGNVRKGVIHLKEAAKIRASNNESGEPFKTLGSLASSLELLDIQCALSLYDEISTSLHNDTSSPEAIRNSANALYAAARLRCLELKLYREALSDLDKAIPLLQHFLEDRDSLAGALNLKTICLQKTGDAAEAEKIFKIRADFLITFPNLESALFNKKSGDLEDGELKRKVEVAENLEKLDTIPRDQLLFFIEEQIDILEKNLDSTSKISQAYLLSYYGEHLATEHKYALAIGYFGRAKALYPSYIRNNILLAMALHRNQNYADAIQVGLNIIKNHPTIAFAFYTTGVSAYKIGNYPLAEQMFESAMQLDPNLDQINHYLENTKEVIREQRLLGIQHISSYQASIYPSTHERFLDYLQGFKSRCQRNADSFWKSYANQEFIQNPENVGRALLVQDIQATVNIASIYKETILAGGRIDLVVNILGNEFILELKMCGNGYSKSYAEGGFDQLKSYMHVRDAKRSYLVVFDARAKQDDVHALPKELDLGEGQIAFCIGIDIRSMKS